MNPDFNPIAGIYYPLSRLVFGKAQDRAQEHFIRSVHPVGRILIVGGGNGKILESLSKLPLKHAEIFFVEPAARMLRLARKTGYPVNRVHFIQNTIEQYLAGTEASFDTIITAFFFDLFPQEQADAHFQLLNSRLKPGGYWICTDFQNAAPPSWWHRPLLKIMYRFFRAVSNVQASRLPGMENNWGKNFILVQQQAFYGRLILTQLWKKQPPGS